MSHKEPIEIDIDDNFINQHHHHYDLDHQQQQSNNLFIRTPEGAVLYPSFYIGQHVVVEVGSAQFLHATVECVEVDREPNSSSYSSSSAHHHNNPNNQNHQEADDDELVFVYFVHFADQDRRLDAWVTADKLRVSTNIGMSAAFGRNGSNNNKNAKNSSKNAASSAIRTRSQLYQNTNNHNTQTQNSSANSSRGQSVASSTPASTTAHSLLLQNSASSGVGSGSASFPSSSNSNSISSTMTNNFSQSQNEKPSSTYHHQPTTGKHYAAATRHGTADSKFFDRPKNVAKFVIGDVEVDSWYYSPYLLAHPKVREGIERYNIFATIPSDLNIDVVGSNNNNNNKYQNKSNNIASSLSNSKQNQNNSSNSNNQSAAAASRHFTLHLCPYCFEPELDHESIVFHLLNCLRRPPGREIYRDPKNSLIVFECDGALHPHFAKNIALVSKAFLEHKSLDWDMNPFVFYVVCRYDDFDDGAAQKHANESSTQATTTSTTFTTVMNNSPGCRITSYFSKEKQNAHNYNLSCILTLPQFQSNGYGRFMIDMSYEMSRREGKVGSPEKPLSDLGERMYRGVWKEKVLDVLASWGTQLGGPVVIGQNHPSKEFPPMMSLLSATMIPSSNNSVSDGSVVAVTPLSSTFISAPPVSTSVSQTSSSSSILSIANNPTKANALISTLNSNPLTTAQVSLNQAFSSLSNSPYHSTQVHFTRTITLDALMQATGMIKEDVSKALQDLKCLDQSRSTLMSSSSSLSAAASTIAGSSTNIISGGGSVIAVAGPTQSQSQQLRIKLNLDPEILKKHFRTKIDRQRRGHAIFEPSLLHWFPQWYAAGKGYTEAIRAMNAGGSFAATAARLPNVDLFKIAEAIVDGTWSKKDNLERNNRGGHHQCDEKKNENSDDNEDDDDDENQSLGSVLAAKANRKKATALVVNGTGDSTGKAKSQRAVRTTSSSSSSRKNNNQKVDDHQDAAQGKRSTKRKSSALSSSSAKATSSKKKTSESKSKSEKSGSKKKSTTSSSSPSTKESGKRRQRNE